MEGPSLFLLREETKQFAGKRVLEAKGYAKIDFSLLQNKVVQDIRTWGKHYLILFPQFTVRVHFGLFGNYRVDEHKAGKNASMHLRFSNGELNCYIAHIKIIEEEISDIYDWRLDMLSEKWNAAYVKKVVSQQPAGIYIGDLLLNPDIFSGVGNIIRNEVLYRCGVHPASPLGKLPSDKITAIIKDTHKYSLEFLHALPSHTVGKTWTVYNKKLCPKGHTVIKSVMGKTKRNVFICKVCQKKYK